MRRFIYVLLIFAFSFSLYSFSIRRPVNNKKPLVWNLQDIKELRVNYGFDETAQSVLTIADQYCNDSPLSVTVKQKTFAPNIHYYCSVGPYWWPDTLGGEKYINRDGIVNPESKLYDSSNLFGMSKRCQYLSRAYYITRDNKYYDSFITQLKTWFINENSYMEPSFAYAQVIPGHDNNMGRSTGMIDAYTLNSVIESIRLVNGIKIIDKKVMKALQVWFKKFADDSEIRYGDTFRVANNNLSLAYDVMLINMYLFAGETVKAKSIADSFYEKRIVAQIREDGSQPAELQRTLAMHYSLYNLSHIIDFCYMVRCWYPDYYRENGQLIDKALSFLSFFVNNPDAFPYQQISGWDECSKEYNTLMKRRDYLMNNVLLP